MRTLAAISCALILAAPIAAIADQRELFLLDAVALDSPTAVQAGSNNLIGVVEDFIKLEGDFAPIDDAVGASGYVGRLDYLGVADAVRLNVNEAGTQLTLQIPSTGTSVNITGTDPNDLFDQVEDWLQEEGADEWFDFLREANARTPLAVTSGNPKSTVALFGDSAYRKFGIDDSRSRFGYETEIQRWGAFELRIDVGGSSVNTGTFDDDLYTIDPTITLAGDFGRLIGLSFSVIGQYRDYDGAQIFDLGFELALPLSFVRPSPGSPWYWQLTPVIQSGAGASVDFAAGGLMFGGGLVSGLAYNIGPFELLMANQILYYGGIPIDNIGGYDFDTKLSQLYFKNGLEGTWHPGAGFYADAGIHFTNFALDDAAVPFYFTPAVGIGFQAGRWFDIRLAYEADLDAEDYVSHNLQLKLDFLF